MRTSVSQDRDFIATIIPGNLLEEAIEFVKNTFDAEDLYGKEYMEEWALDNGFIKED